MQQKLNPPGGGLNLWRAQKDWTPLPAWRAGIPLSTRNDLGALRFPNLLRIEPFTVLVQLSAKKINPPFGGLNFLAERIGLEPMDQKFRSQISNLLHYHSANAPCWVIISVQHIKIKGKFSVFLTNLSYIKKSPELGIF